MLFGGASDFGNVLNGYLELETAETVKYYRCILPAIGHADFPLQVLEQRSLGELTTDDLDVVMLLGDHLGIHHRTVGQLQQLTKSLYLYVGDTCKVREVVGCQRQGGVFHVTRQEVAFLQDIDAVFLGHADKYLSMNHYLLLDGDNGICRGTLLTQYDLRSDVGLYWIAEGFGPAQHLTTFEL